jgi:hypothetical protein
MTENKEEDVKTEGFGIEEIYIHWLKHYHTDGLTGSDAKRHALEQTLHKASLMAMDNWENDTSPGQIADFILKTVPEEVGWWLQKGNNPYRRRLEQDKHDPGFRRVFRVKNELVSRMRRVKKED